MVIASSSSGLSNNQCTGGSAHFHKMWARARATSAAVAAATASATAARAASGRAPCAIADCARAAGVRATALRQRGQEAPLALCWSQRVKQEVQKVWLQESV